MSSHFNKFEVTEGDYTRVKVTAGDHNRVEVIRGTITGLMLSLVPKTELRLPPLTIPEFRL